MIAGGFAPDADSAERSKVPAVAGLMAVGLVLYFVFRSFEGRSKA
jgi:hypothetical protein